MSEIDDIIEAIKASNKLYQKSKQNIESISDEDYLQKIIDDEIETAVSASKSVKKTTKASLVDKR